MKDIQKLDAILSLLSLHNDKRGMHNMQIKELLKHDKIDLPDTILTEILFKLVKDGYLRIEIDDAPIGVQIIKDVNYYLITFDGLIFTQKGGYKSDARRKKVTEFPKNYWWLIALFTFFVGLFSDIIKERMKQRILPELHQYLSPIGK